MKSIFALTISLLVLSACATPETRVRTALLDAGIARPVATCMADRMVDRLSLGQLHKLSRLSNLRDKRIGDMTIAEFVKHSRALGDPKILSVVTSAGLGCAIAS
jgi:hypothetical protein